MAFIFTDDQSYQEVYKAYLASGSKAVVKLDGQVRSQVTFDLDDVIQFPEPNEWTPLAFKIGNQSITGILVKVTNGEAVRYQPFYANTLGKRILRLELDDELNVVSEEYVRHGGEAAKEFQSKQGLKIDDVLKEMASKHPNGIKVTSVESIRTYKFKSEDLTYTNLYTFDFV